MMQWPRVQLGKLWSAQLTFKLTYLIYFMQSIHSDLKFDFIYYLLEKFRSVDFCLIRYLPLTQKVTFK